MHGCRSAGRVSEDEPSSPQLEQQYCVQETDEEGEGEAPASHLVESQAERVRRSLVTLDINMPSIALPDGVHCRSFTGASPPVTLIVWERHRVARRAEQPPCSRCCLLCAQGRVPCAACFCIIIFFGMMRSLHP